MFEVEPSIGHRLLAPRVAYLIGTYGSDLPNLAPISNVTSVSREPQVLVVAVYREWQTYRNLCNAKGFTISVPTIGHNEAVWRLGEKYSGFTPTGSGTKLEQCGASLDYQWSEYGPVLADGVGWLECTIVGGSDVETDHGVFFGRVTRAVFNEEFLGEDGYYIKNSEPVMQLVGNTFATSTEAWTNKYF